MYNVYDCHINTRTHNFNGMEWVVDGERGRDTYPGTYPKELCVRLYRAGVSWGSILKAYHAGDMKRYNELLKKGGM